jgi:hypothetical protein
VIQLVLRAADLRAELADVLRLAAGRDATVVALRAGAFFAAGCAPVAFLAVALAAVAFFAAAFLAVALLAVAFLAVALLAVAFFAVALVAVVFFAVAFVAVDFFAALVAVDFTALDLVAVAVPVDLAAVFPAGAFLVAVVVLAPALLAAATFVAVALFAGTFAAAGLAVDARTVLLAAVDAAGATRFAEDLAVWPVAVRAVELRESAFGADVVRDDGLALPDLVPAGRDAAADLLAVGRTDARLAAPGFAADADLDGAADFDIADFGAAAFDVADFGAAAFDVTGFAAVAFALPVVPALAAGFGVMALAVPARPAVVADFLGAAGLRIALVVPDAFAAVGFLAAVVAGCFAAAVVAGCFAVAGFLAGAVVAGFLATAVVAGFLAAGFLPAAAPVARFGDAAGLSAVVVLVPARLAAGLVGALVAAAIRTFLLANDCGLVSAWRLTRFRLGHRKSAPA